MGDAYPPIKSAFNTFMPVFVLLDFTLLNYVNYFPYLTYFTYGLTFAHFHFLISHISCSGGGFEGGVLIQVSSVVPLLC